MVLSLPILSDASEISVADGAGVGNLEGIRVWKQMVLLFVFQGPIEI